MDGFQILVVDDDAFVRELVAETLTLGDFRVLQAGDGAEALALVEREAVHLALLDVRLGSAPDGLELCRLLRARRDAPTVILLTALADNDDVAAGLAAGAAAYLTKPFSPLELLERVQAVREGR